MSKARTTREEIDHIVEAYKSGMSLCLYCGTGCN